jgi:thiol-disulfide isomerase/thioredoxin
MTLPNEASMMSLPRPLVILLMLALTGSAQILGAAPAKRAKPSAAPPASAAKPEIAPAPASAAKTEAVAPVTASAAKPEAPAAAATPGTAAGEEPPPGPIEKLFKDRQWQKCLDEVAALRERDKKPIADVESEYWAARCESSLKLIEAARARFEAIARAYPDTDRGMQSAIEKTTVRLNTIEGKARLPAELKLATDSALELEATGKALAGKDPEVISRAYYVAGNAWRMASEDDKANVAYNLSAAQPAKDYPAKSLYMLGIDAMQEFNDERARTLWTRCSEQYPESTGIDKCNKAIARLALIGTPAPELDVETWIKGPPVKLADLRGQVVLVWFFATWCPHCKATMPDMAALKRRYAGKPLTIIGITNNTKEQTTESAKLFVDDPRWEIDYPIAVDNDGNSSMAFEASGIPSAALIDARGRIRYSDHPAYLTDAMIDRLLAEAPGPTAASGH